MSAEAVRCSPPSRDEWGSREAVLEALGVRVRIRAREPGLIARLAGRLPPAWRAGEPGVADVDLTIDVGGDGRWIVEEGGVLEGTPRSPARALAALEQLLENRIAELSPDFLCLHAGVVAVEGGALLIPGRTGSGKSTLVAALVRAGAAYYSDDLAPIDGDGRVHAYGADLSLRSPVPHRIPGVSLAPAPPPPLPVRAIVLTCHAPGRRYAPEPATPGRAALALLRHTISARRDPARALARLPRIAAGAVVLAGPRGEAAEAAAVVLACIAGARGLAGDRAS